MLWPSKESAQAALSKMNSGTAEKNASTGSIDSDTAHGTTGSLEGHDERNRAQLAHLDENIELLAHVKPNVVVMGHILHDWDLETKRMLTQKAYEAVPEGGAFIVFESIIDDDRSKNAFGLMMSLNMLVEFGEAFDYSGADFDLWCREAGFRRTEVIHLAGPASAGVAYK